MHEQERVRVSVCVWEREGGDKERVRYRKKGAF
jgi:hypothetical protein